MRKSQHCLATTIVPIADIYTYDVIKEIIRRNSKNTWRIVLHGCTIELSKCVELRRIVNFAVRLTSSCNETLLSHSPSDPIRQDCGNSNGCENCSQAKSPVTLLMPSFE